METNPPWHHTWWMQPTYRDEFHKVWIRCNNCRRTTQVTPFRQNWPERCPHCSFKVPEPRDRVPFLKQKFRTRHNLYRPFRHWDILLLTPEYVDPGNKPTCVHALERDDECI